MKKKLGCTKWRRHQCRKRLKNLSDSDGLWNGYNVEDVATPRAWNKDPQLVLDFYNQRRKDVLHAVPNAAHLGLAALEKDFDVHIITQNIDDLHERAGSTNVLHLHGEIFKMRSEKNVSLIYDVKGDIKIGDKASDDTQLRPFIVWFEEAVPMIEPAASLTENAEIFVVVGTSLAVYPAAGLVNYAPRFAPKFIVDKNIPYISALQNIIAIEKPATEGIEDLRKYLEKLV